MAQENSNNSYAGMTINERLFVSGLMGSFDKARARKDRDLMIKILTKTEMSEYQAKQTVDAILK
tara:strand:- start:825 stop:1016 length:192 start_codon:yes stop_codon:yes gene_type:complete